EGRRGSTPGRSFRRGSRQRKELFEGLRGRARYLCRQARPGNFSGTDLAAGSLPSWIEHEFVRERTSERLPVRRNLDARPDHDLSWSVGDQGEGEGGARLTRGLPRPNPCRPVPGNEDRPAVG